MLDRRLQSQVYYKGFAPSMRSARNMIVHGHIVLGKQRMNVPGYHVLREEESEIAYHPTSNFNDPNHAVRQEMDRRRQTVGGDDAETIEQIKADEAATKATENKDGGEA